jgi:hypothetical protein
MGNDIEMSELLLFGQVQVKVIHLFLLGSVSN